MTQSTHRSPLPRRYIRKLLCAPIQRIPLRVWIKVLNSRKADAWQPPKPQTDDLPAVEQPQTDDLPAVEQPQTDDLPAVETDDTPDLEIL